MRRMRRVEEGDRKEDVKDNSYFAAV